MMNNFVAYDLSELRKKLALSNIKGWHKAGLVEESEMLRLGEKYHSNLYSPTVFMRLFLFCATLLAIFTTLMPIAIALGFDFDNEIAWRVIYILLGLIAIIVSELKFIRASHHYKSGVTEAGYFGGASFLYVGIIGFNINSSAEVLSSFVFAMILFAVITIRYLDLIAIIGALCCFIGALFVALEPIMALLPFVTMLVFAGLYLLSRKLQTKVNDVLWEDHFVVFDALALLLVFIGGNYFVVRELSLGLMGLNLSDGSDIPFAFLFYFLTASIPIGYLLFGMLKREMLFIRIGLFCIALSILTAVNYNFLDNPQLTSAVIGALMILVSLGLMKYLKKNRNGYTREQLLESKWENSDLAAFVASQTLGGHQIDGSEETFTNKGANFGGGETGGGGSGGKF
jgi:hypothetical protein